MAKGRQFKDFTSIKEVKDINGVLAVILSAALIFSLIIFAQDNTQNKRLASLEKDIQTTENQVRSYDAEIKRYFSEYLGSDQAREDIITYASIKEDMFELLKEMGLVLTLTNDQMDTIVLEATENLINEKGIGSINDSTYSQIYNTIYRNVYKNIMSSLTDNGKIVINQYATYDVDSITNTVLSKIRTSTTYKSSNSSNTATAEQVQEAYIKSVVKEVVNELKVDDKTTSTISNYVTNNVLAYLQNNNYGKQGKDGVDGKTPELSIDYYTEEEQIDIVKQCVQEVVEYIRSAETDPTVEASLNFSTGFGIDSDNVSVSHIRNNKGYTSVIDFLWVRGDGETKTSSIQLPTVDNVMSMTYDEDAKTLTTQYVGGKQESVEIESLAEAVTKSYCDNLYASMQELVFSYNTDFDVKIKDGVTTYVCKTHNNEMAVSVDNENLIYCEDGCQASLHPGEFEANYETVYTCTEHNSQMSVTYNSDNSIDLHCANGNHTVKVNTVGEGEGYVKTQGYVYTCSDCGNRMTLKTDNTTGAQYLEDESGHVIPVANFTTLNNKLTNVVGTLNDLLDDSLKTNVEKDIENDEIREDKTLTAIENMTALKEEMLIRYTSILQNMDKDMPSHNNLYVYFDENGNSTLKCVAHNHDFENLNDKTLTCADGCSVDISNSHTGFETYDIYMANVGINGNVDLSTNQNCTIGDYGIGSEIVETLPMGELVLRSYLINKGFVIENNGLLEWAGSTTEEKLQNAYKSNLTNYMNMMFKQIYTYADESNDLQGTTQERISETIAKFESFASILDMLEKGGIEVTLSYEEGTNAFTTQLTDNETAKKLMSVLFYGQENITTFPVKVECVIDGVQGTGDNFATSNDNEYFGLISQIKGASIDETGRITIVTNADNSAQLNGMKVKISPAINPNLNVGDNVELDLDYIKVK